MKPKLKVRRNDMVEVVTGDSRGTRGRVLRTIPDKGRVVVEGVNIVWKHMRPGLKQRGGRVEREAPIHVSNVMLLCQNKECPRHDKPVRVRIVRNADGTKNRACIKCGAAIVSE